MDSFTFRLPAVPRMTTHFWATKLHNHPLVVSMCRVPQPQTGHSALSSPTWSSNSMLRSTTRNVPGSVLTLAGPPGTVSTPGSLHIRNVMKFAMYGSKNNVYPIIWLTPKSFAHDKSDPAISSLKGSVYHSLDYDHHPRGHCQTRGCRAFLVTCPLLFLS